MKVIQMPPYDPSEFKKKLAEAKAGAAPRRLLGASIIDYAERGIDLTVNLLGNRWISRFAGGFIVAPSGHGKSSLVVQAALCWSCGMPCFGIKPARPLRVFIVQAEDDNNDVIEMSQMVERLKLAAHYREMARENTHLEWLNDAPGRKFFPAMNDLLSEWKCDLLILNPYTAYQSEDIQDTEANNLFLRDNLAALMKAHYLGCLIVHHTGKTQFQKKGAFAWYDWMYDMSGGAVLTNWARAVLVVLPTTIPGTYKFIAAKRFEKIGWTEREYWFSHSIENGQMLWIPSNGDQIAGAKVKGEVDPDDLLSLIPLLDPISQVMLKFQSRQKFGLGRDKTAEFLKILTERNLISVVEVPRPNARPELFYVKNTANAMP